MQLSAVTFSRDKFKFSTLKKQEHVLGNMFLHQCFQVLFGPPHFQGISNLLNPNLSSSSFTLFSPDFCDALCGAGALPTTIVTGESTPSCCIGKSFLSDRGSEEYSPSVSPFVKRTHERRQMPLTERSSWIACTCVQCNVSVQGKYKTFCLHYRLAAIDEVESGMKRTDHDQIWHHTKYFNGNHERQGSSEGTWLYSEQENTLGSCVPTSGTGTSLVAETSLKLESTCKWSRPTNKN